MTSDRNDLNPSDRSEQDRGGPGELHCEAFADDLTHFVLGELADEKRPALERHLVECSGCRAEREVLARSVELVKQHGVDGGQLLELSPSRRAELLAAASAAPSAPATSRSSTPTARVVRPLFGTFERWAAAAAAIVGVTLVGEWVWHRDRPAYTTCEGTPVTGRASLVDDEARVAAAPSASSLRGNAAPIRSEYVNQLGYTDGSESKENAELVKRPSVNLGVPSIDVIDRKTVPENPPFATTTPVSGRGPTTAGLPSKAGGSAGRYRGPSDTAAPLSKQRDGATSTPDEMKLAREALVKAGVPSSTQSSESAPPTSEEPTMPVPPVGGCREADGLEVLEFQNGDPNQVQLGVDALGERYLALCTDNFAVDSTGRVAGLSTPFSVLAASESLTPAQLAMFLADANAPSTVLALQPKLAAALALDPNTPRGEDVDGRSRELVKDFLDRLAPRQGETPRDMFFRYFGDHPFVSTRWDCKSTFGMDVDHASYALVRNYLAHGVLPPKAAVRTEEFVNSFRHDYAPPKADSGDVFAIHSELAPSPFGENGTWLLELGMKAREVSREQRRPAALTFIVDVSGSMEEGGRLEAVKASLKMLASQLDERDTIGVVTFSSDAHRVLDPINAGNRARIFSAIDSMRPDGSTNAEAGLRLGYDMALEQLRPSAENRVIFCTDGVANVGVTDPKVLSRRAKECKAKNLFLTCVGVGFENHNDALLQQLADETDGTCDYLDRMDEAKKIFVDRLVGTLTTVARDAKIQVEFDPKSVRRFRQIGYEKRALAHQDFRNDHVDAGEVGAGAEVVALYELELQPEASGPLGVVRCRYESLRDSAPGDPRCANVHEQARELFVAEAQPNLSKSTPRFRLAACVAEFAELLRQSVHARDGSFGAVEQLAEPLVAELAGDPDVPEFLALVKQAARLPDLLPRRTELTRACDELKRFRCVREEFRQSDAAKDHANDELMRQMEEQNRKLEEALRNALEHAAR